MCMARSLVQIERLVCSHFQFETKSFSKQLQVKFDANKTSNRLYSYGAPKLSPEEVTGILRANEFTQEMCSGSVRAFDINQLPSNDPIEDRLTIAKCQLTTGVMFGVFDGHGGHLCAEVVSQRIFDYIALSILPPPVLKEFIDSGQNDINLTEMQYEVPGLSEEQKNGHKMGLHNFAKVVAKQKQTSKEFLMNDAVTQAFQQLDADLSQEVQAGIQNHTEEALALSVMGSCACVAHIDSNHLHLATLGDCKGVLGVLGNDNVWTAKTLTREHNSDNVDEMKRILSEHPKSEANVVIKNDRLLGSLAPLRAFGDFNYKWKSSIQQKLLVPVFGQVVIPSNYYTPPYLTAKPEVVHHHLTARDKFLVIASDGLWEQILPHKVVKLIGEYMSGKQILDLLRLPQPHMKLSAINEILMHRRQGLDKKPVDTNVATHLFRSALGWTEYGIEHSKLASMLTLPKPIVRNFRDDISIIVVFFNSDYLRKVPIE